jgi:hypothetical protein
MRFVTKIKNKMETEDRKKLLQIADDLQKNFLYLEGIYETLTMYERLEKHIETLRTISQKP